MVKLIDLSLEISPNLSEPVPVEIEYVSHEDGADLLGKPIGITRKEFPEGIGLTLEHVKLTTHTGTHIDAPIHYGPLCEEKKAKNISELPLSWFYGNGVLVNCVGDLKDGPISKEEIKIKLSQMGYILRPFDIVLLRTDADKLWGQSQYFENFRGVSLEATEWLVEQGIKVIGIDSFGFDEPFDKMLQEYKKCKDINKLWPSHFYGRKKEYCQIERLANLWKIDKFFNFKVVCFPIKIKDCGAGWSRVIAIIEK